MTNSVTHFEIFSEQPATLVGLYRDLLGWQIEKAPGLGYWRTQTATAGGVSSNGSLTLRSSRIPGLTAPLPWLFKTQVKVLSDYLTIR